MAARSATLPPDYPAFLTQLRERIRRAQVRAALAVNSELVLLYWQIGRDILDQQEQQGWGAKVVDRLVDDLRREFPAMKGFSPRNLRYMKAFAAAWPDEPIVQQLAAKLPWFHNCLLLDKLKDPAERLWYVRQTIGGGRPARPPAAGGSSPARRASPIAPTCRRCRWNKAAGFWLLTRTACAAT